MADAKVRIEVESKPVGFDGSKQALKDLERDVKATEKAAVAAQKKLGSGNDELKKKLDAGIASLQGEQKNLAALAVRYAETQKRAAILETQISSLSKRMTKMRESGGDATVEYDRLDGKLQELIDRQGREEEELDYVSKKMNESANAARQMQAGLHGVTQAATEASEAQVRAANASAAAVKIAKTQTAAFRTEMGSARSASMGFMRANMALQQFMAGDLIGAFKSATMAAVSFGRAILADPIVAGLLAIAGAVAIIAVKWKEASDRQKEYRANAGGLDDVARNVEWARSGKSLSNISDKELGAERRRRAGNASWENLDYEVKKERFDATPSTKNMEAAKEAAEKAIAAQQELDAVEDEIERRRLKRIEERRKAEEEARKVLEDYARALREYDQRVEDFQKKQWYDQLESKDGKVASLYAQRQDLLEQANDPKFEFADKSIERQKIMEQVYEIERQIADEQKKQAEAQGEWERKRKLAKATEEERLKIINSEIAALRKLPRTAENEAKMRGLIDQRDATQKEIDKKNEKAQADAQKAAEKQAEDDKKLKDKARDFLHRNGGDAQRMRDIRVQLGEAAASGDMGTMLDLMMQGESIADAHPGKQTLTQRKQAERKAKHDEKEAQKEAVKMRAEISAIERGLRKGDASAIEKVAKMNAQQAGRASYEMKGGKLVKVEGTDQTNTLLHDILEALK